MVIITFFVVAQKNNIFASMSLIKKCEESNHTFVLDALVWVLAHNLLSRLHVPLSEVQFLKFGVGGSGHKHIIYQ